MFKVQRDPTLWLTVAAGAAGAMALLFDPAHQWGYLAVMGFPGLLWMLSWLIKRIWKAPIPDTAVRELLERCTNQNDEWILVKFRPLVSLEEARRKVGSETYSEEDRLGGFMTKFSFVAPSQPEAGIFYSPEKGFLLARRKMILALEEKFGRWMIDTWYCLLARMVKMGMTAVDLDPPQVFRFDRHVGSV